jgi:hypothetical protein
MRVLAAVILGSLVPIIAQGAVLCAKPSRTGTFNGTVKVREACKPNEAQLSPGEVNFCCAASTTTTVTTSSSMCPTFTTTTLGIPDCFGGGGACNGLCANAHACVPGAGGACACTGPELPCGVVSAFGACGGTCPENFACGQFAPTQPNGCPGLPRCGCIPGP